ncbi:MAG TPA: hypothetical protein VGR37_01920 [Longimicrobiaceae bacterium]|nr:hypothetical protein [Longimicrobiaceae bacterium]
MLSSTSEIAFTPHPPFAAMPSWLEFHDSMLEEVRSVAGGAVLQLRGYIHRWQQTPAGWRGEGGSQRVDVFLRDAEIFRLPEPQVWISSGTLRIRNQLHVDLVPLPFRAEGPIRLDLELASGSLLRFSAAGTQFLPVGEFAFVELLPEEFRPSSLVP